MPIRLPLLPADPSAPFPPADRALREPNGLLAMGGDLGPTRLLNAYRAGVFPWFGEDQPILWWSPDPRAVFETAHFQLARRFRRSLQHSTCVIRADSAFDAVIEACAHIPRPGQHGSWITPAMLAAYRELHRLGHAHSIEVFEDGQLVGGLYGVAIGRMFFGESMFSVASGSSKLALAALARRLHAWGWPLIDAQVENPHLLSLGARLWPRPAFLQAVSDLVELPETPGHWRDRFPPIAASELAHPPG